MTISRAKPDQHLVFLLNEAPLVAAGYHVTELKAVTYNTMDCGGVADAWEETVVQLWNPGDEPERERDPTRIPKAIRGFRLSLATLVAIPKSDGRNDWASPSEAFEIFRDTRTRILSVESGIQK